MLVERLFPVSACFISIFWLLLYTVISQAVCIANSIKRWRSCLSQGTEADLSPGQNNKDNISPPGKGQEVSTLHEIRGFWSFVFLSCGASTLWVQPHRSPHIDLVGLGTKKNKWESLALASSCAMSHKAIFFWARSLVNQDLWNSHRPAYSCNRANSQPFTAFRSTY